MITSYVFLKVGPEGSPDSLSLIRGIEGVKQAHAVMGPIDGIVFVEVQDQNALWDTISAIRAVDGILHTDTRLAWHF
jgi:nitrate reductase NapAB chaperone NapD